MLGRPTTPQKLDLNRLQSALRDTGSIQETHSVEQTPSAVLLPLYFDGGHAHILLTKRSESLRHHRGQISFPGGKCESGDANYLSTALRETHEEIGLPPERVQVLGALSPIPTPTGFYIYPYVGLIPYPYEYQTDPGEIACLIQVPLAHLLAPKNHRTEIRQAGGQDRLIHYYDYKEWVIWGVTGYLLWDCLEKIRNKT